MFFQNYGNSGFELGGALYDGDDAIIFHKRTIRRPMIAILVRCLDVFNI